MNKAHLPLVLALTLFIVPMAVSQNTGSQNAAGSATTSNEDLALLKENVQSQKKQIVAANLKLTDAEAVKFWPIYDQYSAELGKQNEARLGLIKEYADAYPNISDSLAQSIVSRWLKTDEAVAGVRSKYMPMMEKVLSGKTLARFFQIDRRLGILIDVQVTSEVPLVP